MLIKLSHPQFEPGYWQGMRQPAVLVLLHFSRMEISTAALKRFDAICAEIFPSSDRNEISALIADDKARQHPVVMRVLGMSLEILSQMGMPIMSGVKAFLAQTQQAAQSWQIGLPAISEQIPAPQAAIAFACGLMNELAHGVQVSANTINVELKKRVQQFRPLAPSGVNTLHFLQAAHEMEIPWCHIANNVYQFGWGKNSRWLDSSFTDQTSQISAGLARDKVACAKVLRNAGLPVPRHQLVGNAEQAVKVAQMFGFPVVVKPANLDGGQGVMAGVRDEDGVRKAFAAASKLSRRVLVEQFIEGDDYRVRVFNGQVTAVVARRPASITGDGINTVQSLIEKANAERAKQPLLTSPSVERGTSPIVIDSEVRQWLRYHGYSLDSVIAQGQRVRLRGAANVSLGGTTWHITEEQVHPNNLELALYAVNALRLDVAGVDILFPDISRSWKESGGAICEINAQPQFSTEVAYRQFLENLVPNGGRIPVALIREISDASRVESALMQLLGNRSFEARWVKTHQECRAALIDKKTSVVLFASDSGLGEDLTLPFDRVDLTFGPAGFDDSVMRLANWVKAGLESGKN